MSKKSSACDADKLVDFLDQTKDLPMSDHIRIIQKRRLMRQNKSEITFDNSIKNPLIRKYDFILNTFIASLRDTDLLKSRPKVTEPGIGDSTSTDSLYDLSRNASKTYSMSTFV